MMDDGAIISALQKGVTAAVAASTNPSLPISYIEKAFAVPDDQKWLEIVWIPNNRDDFWGDERNYQGMLRLVLHWPNNNSGPYLPLELLKSIAAFFQKGKVLSGVQVYGIADFTGAIQGGDDLLYPISIRYQSYRS